jgi:hypothetical protein
LTVAAGLASAPSAVLAGTGCTSRNDDVWLVDTCAAPCGTLSQAHLTTYSAQRLIGNCWEHSTSRQFVDSTYDGRLTVIWVHGHRVDRSWAVTNGMEIYRGLVAACPTPPPPIRFVIWKWPSERSSGPVRDAREKAGIADHQTYKLAWMLGQLPRETPLSLIGFSYGARVLTGALHLTAGGSFCGYRVQQPHASTLRAVLWAAGEPTGWIAAGGAHGRATLATDATLNLYNCCDPALRHFPRVNGGTALGYTGIDSSSLPAGGGRFGQRNVCGEVNHLHLTRSYSLNSGVMAMTRQYALWQPV